METKYPIGDVLFRGKKQTLWNKYKEYIRILV